MVAFSYMASSGMPEVKIYQVEMRSGRSNIITVYTNDAAGLVEQFNRGDGLYVCRLIETCIKCGKQDSEVSDGLCSNCFYLS